MIPDKRYPFLMRILLIAEVFHPDTIGGAGRVAAEHAFHLAEHGHEVRVVARRTPMAPEKFEQRGKFSIYRFPVNTGNPFSLMKETKSGLESSLDDALSGFRPDIIDLHQPLASYHALSHRGLTGIPAVYTFHSSWADELRVRGRAHALFAPIAGRIEKDVLQHANTVIVLSEYSRRRVSGILSHPAVEIVPGGVDLDQFPVKTRPRKEGPMVLLTVRNLVRRMGLDLLISAAVELKKKKESIELRIGGDGPLLEELRELAHPLGASCRFLGRIPEEKLSATYREADLFVLPTIAIEGFGLVILEAFASGTPVIGTPVGAIPELVGLQGDGYVSSGATAEALADILSSFLHRPDAIGREGLRAIAEEYSWKRRCGRIEEIYRKLIAR